MDQTARQYVQRSACVTSSPRRRASSRTLGGRSATFTVAIGGAVARQARDRHSDLRCMGVRRSAENPFARGARLVKRQSVHVARPAGRICVCRESGLISIARSRGGPTGRVGSRCSSWRSPRRPRRSFSFRQWRDAKPGRPRIALPLWRNARLPPVLRCQNFRNRRRARESPAGQARPQAGFLLALAMGHAKRIQRRDRPPRRRQRRNV